jgi:hypothetical protein
MGKQLSWDEERLAWWAGCLFERWDGGWDERVKVEEVDVFFRQIGSLESCVYGFGDGWAGGEGLAFPDCVCCQPRLRWGESILSQLSLSRVPAPPRGYIHLSSGTPSSRANCVEVRMHAAATLMLLKAFISKGSGRAVS